MIQMFRLWVCRCADGRCWVERPRHHMTCADCGALVAEREVMQVKDALCYSADSIKAASRGY